MKISRRTILRGAGALPLVVGNFGFAALAQTTAAAPSATEFPPILFVHGNGDHAALWMTALWRMESNGVPRDRMSAINFTDPLARADDTKAEPNKSSTEDQRRELGEAVQELKRRTGATRVALVGNSRGGYSIRGLHQEWRRSRRQPRRAVRRSQSRRLCLGRRSQQRVQRSRPVPARPERGRERSDARAPRS